MEQTPISPHPLDRLVEREAFAEILDQLQPEELVLAALRLEGLTDVQIGALLGVSRAMVSYRFQRARRRIMAECPELAPWLRGRRRSCPSDPDDASPPLERGWLCSPAPTEPEENAPPPLMNSLSSRNAARLLGINARTITRWARQGRFPHAYRTPGPRGDYRIPISDLYALPLQE